MDGVSLALGLQPPNSKVLPLLRRAGEDRLGDALGGLVATEVPEANAVPGCSTPDSNVLRLLPPRRREPLPQNLTKALEGFVLTLTEAHRLCQFAKDA